jgi:hypothetical protein
MTLADGSKVEVVSCEAPVIIPPSENQTGNVTEPIPPIENNTSGNVTEPTQPPTNQTGNVTLPIEGNVTLPVNETGGIVGNATGNITTGEPIENVTTPIPPIECQPGTHADNGVCVEDGGFSPNNNVSSGNLTG